MASAILFNGRRINRPGVYSKLDASELAGVSPAATGIVALIGTAEGGKPLTIDSTYSDLTTPGQALTRFRSGDLRIASQFAFEPSLDDAVPGGAQRIVAVKVNPATQSEATLQDDDAIDSIDLTSADYGLFTTQINVEVEAGTTQGKKVTILFEDTEEVFDDVGGDAVFSLDYTPGSAGYSALTGAVTSAAFTLSATKTATGLVAERTANIAAAGLLEYLSSDVGDTTQTITIYGLDGGGDPVSETITLTGTTVVAGTQSFEHVLGAIKSAATTGTVTIRSTVPTTLFSMAPGVLTRGVLVLTNAMAQGTVSVAIDSAAAVAVALFGLTASGAAVADTWDMTAGGTVAGTETFGTLQVLALGAVAGARTITLTLTATRTTHASYSTVQRVVDRLNAIEGWTATAVAGDSSTFLMADLDYVSGVSVMTEADFAADLMAVVNTINASSGLLTAERNASGVAAPADTSAPIFLEGGEEGTVSASEWQEAFALLKKRRVNTIVPLTRDPAVHALLATHLVWRAGRSEANGYIGIATAGELAETKANIKSQIRALRTRHISAISQEPQRFDPDTLEATWYPPHMLAAIAAGMQAGSSVGEPLTNKVPLVQDVRQSATWSTEDDAEEMIDAGLMFLRKVDSEGISWERSITTHLADDNPVYTEMSANAAANEAVFRLRRVLQLRIGRKGLATSIGAIKGLAVDELNKLADPVEGVIVSWRNLTIEQVGDVFPISVELAPVQPINFIPVTVHLVAARAAA